jgi:DNA-binding HxlR family transcriptional regulator
MRRYFRSQATIAFNAGKRRRTQMSGPGNDQEFDRIVGILNNLGKSWTLQLLGIMGSREATRFSEFKRSLDISGTVLSERLLELEREGLVMKKIYGTMPPRVEYCLTARARELENILAAFVERNERRHSIYPMTN